MDDLLRKQFEAALSQARGAHASNIRRDCLPAFVRMARADPVSVGPVVEMLTRLATFGYGNAVPSLYCLLRLADVSDEMRTMVRGAMGEELISYLAEDEDESVRGNARILKQVLGGARFSEFETEEESGRIANVYNLQNSNLAIHSPNTHQNLMLTELDDESRGLLRGLAEAVEKKDKPAIMQALSYIADKSVDLLISIIATKALTG